MKRIVFWALVMVLVGWVDVTYTWTDVEEIVYSRCVLRGIDAQEDVERVGNKERVGMSIDEDEGYITLWSESPDAMIVAEYIGQGVARNANSLEIKVKYSGEGWLDIVNVQESTSERDWTDKYFLGKTIWGRKTINVDPRLYVDEYGRVEIRIAVSGQTITVKSIEVKALSSVPVERVVYSYRYFPATYRYSVYHYRYPWGYVYIEEGPYRYVRYERWWESPYYTTYQYEVYRAIVCHHPPVRHKYITYVDDPPVWVVKNTGCSSKTLRVVGSNKPKTRDRSVLASRTDEQGPIATTGNSSVKKTRMTETEKSGRNQQENSQNRFRIIGRDEGQDKSKKMAPSRDGVGSRVLSDRTGRTEEQTKVSRFKIKDGTTQGESRTRDTSSVHPAPAQDTGHHEKIRREAHLQTQSERTVPNRETNQSFSVSTRTRQGPSGDSVRTSSSSSSTPVKTRREEVRSAPAPQSRPAPAVSSSSVKKDDEEQKRRAEASRSASSGSGSSGEKRRRR